MHATDARIRRALRNTIGDALRRSARKNPRKEAILFGERRWTYADLDAAVNKVAHALLARGLARGDRLAVYARNSDIYAITWLACTRAGFIHVPINYMLTGEELLYIVNQSGSRALFYDPDLAPQVEAVRDRAGAEITGTLEELLQAALDPAGSGKEPEVERADTDVVQLLYTSGTTAAPKGAMMTHRALLAEYVSCIIELDQSPEDRSLNALSACRTPSGSRR